MIWTSARHDLHMIKLETIVGHVKRGNLCFHLQLSGITTYATDCEDNQSPTASLAVVTQL